MDFAIENPVTVLGDKSESPLPTFVEYLNASSYSSSSLEA
jgi:hypothetical protein